MTYVNFINGFDVIRMLTLLMFDDHNFRNTKFALKFKCINFAMTFSHICSCKFICEKMLRYDNSMNIYNKSQKKLGRIQVQCSTKNLISNRKVFIVNQYQYNVYDIVNNKKHKRK